jgi:hypothetical protein
VSTPKSYFLQSFLIIILSSIFFIGLKEVLPKKIFPDAPKINKSVLIDSLLLDEYAKNKKLKINDDTLHNQPITFIATDGIVFPEEDYTNFNGYQYLVPFFEKLYLLETTKQGNVRIAYFGDSMTDGDMIVQDLRSSFQSTYGGKGVGFVSITSESANNRASIKHQFSSNWKSQNYVTVKNPSRAFGVNGHVFFANDTINNPWVRFQASNYKNLNGLDNPTIFYGNSTNTTGQLVYTIGKDTLRKDLVSDNILNTLVLNKTSLKSLKANFEKANNIPIYGFNFDDGTGVHIDNFSKRGNSGLPIAKFDIPLMNAFQEKLGYDLIVLHYGTNVLSYGSLDYNWYYVSMLKTVEQLQACFPEVNVLIVSTADKATKYDTEMKTDSAVVPLTNAQKRCALKSQSGFVNLYQLMGGDGTITKWAEEEPIMANKDYTHFNHKGAKKVAELLYNKLQEGYLQFKILRANKMLAPVKKEDSSFVKTSNK